MVKITTNSSWKIKGLAVIRAGNQEEGEMYRYDRLGGKLGRPKTVTRKSYYGNIVTFQGSII